MTVISQAAATASQNVPPAAQMLVQLALHEDDLTIASDAAREALRAVRFPLSKDHELGMSLPRELSDEQKTVALALSAREELDIGRFALPSGRDIVERWLGVAPATLLEATVTYSASDGTTRSEPRWARYRRQRINVSLADIEPIDSIEALETVIALLSHAYRLHVDPRVAQTIIRAVGARGLALANRTLDELSPRIEAARNTDERARLVKNKHFIQYAFVSAGAPFDQRIVPFLTFLPCSDEDLIALVRWLPEQRRDELVLEVLRRDSLGHARTGAKILRDFALPKTAASVADEHCKDTADHQTPTAIKKQTASIIDQAARRHPSIAAALAPALSSATRKSLGLKAPRRPSPREHPPSWSPLPSNTPIDQRARHFIEGLEAGCLRGKSARPLRDEGAALLDATFRNDSPVSRRPHTLSEIERALLLKYMQHLGHPYLIDAGLWDERLEVERALGLASPSSHDVELELDNSRAPVWCWIREHLHRGTPSREQLVETLSRLDAEPRFALFSAFFIDPVRRSETYPYWQGIARVDAGAPPSRRPPPGPHRGRLCRLVASLAWVLGERAERFAIARALDALELARPSLLDGALALSTLNHLAHQRSQTLDARWSPALARIIAFDDVQKDPALRAAILDDEPPLAT
jgi:hypothetical protein